MFEDKLNKTEIKILISIQKEPMTISQLACALDKNPSWISRSVNHLQDLGFVINERVGKSIFVTITKGPLGNSISTLISEEPMLNIERILTDSGLKILPLVLRPGNRANEIALRSSLSLRTIKDFLSRFRKMGVVTLKNGVYVLNESHKPLINLVEHFSYHQIIRYLKNSYSGAIIVWYWRDEFIFSTDQQIQDKRFISAATTRLHELNYDIITTKEYYFHNPILKTMSEEEALIQSYLLNPGNPRIPRLIKDSINKGRVNKKSLFKYARKYGLKKKVEGAIQYAK